MGFQPIDPRGPDQRRKQLLAKIMGQQARPAASWHEVGVGGARAGSFLSNVGRPFRAAGAASSRLNFTHGSNIAESVFARLGVMGHGLANETSPGEGLAIPVTPHADYPPAMGGVPIPTPDVGANGGNIIPSQIQHPLTPPPNLPPSTAVGTGYGDTTAASEGALPSVVSGVVPLGNGLFYDPHTDTVVGSGMAGLGVGARHLGV